MIILTALESIMSIVIMIAAGYVLAKKNWFGDEASKLFPKLVCSISLPAYMIYNLISNFDRDKLFHLAKGLLVPFISIMLCYLAAIIVSKAIKIDKKRRGVFISMFFNSNTIFIGLPINLALFGEKSIPYVLLYYIANTVFFWTLGVYYIRKDGNENKQAMFDLNNIRKIFSPPLVGFIIGVIIIIVKLDLPSFIVDTCKYLGGMTTPISMLFIGMAICSVSLKEIRFSRDMIAIFIGRFIVSPITIYLLTCLIPIPSLMMKVFIVQAGMPIMTQTAIVSKSYGADYKYAAVMTALTTISAVVVIPVYMTMFAFL